MSVYKENIKRIESFYASDLYEKNLKGDAYRIKKVIDALYEDPDKKDEFLLTKASGYSKIFDNKIEFSPDGICGWKILFDVYSENGDSSWLEKYETIRSSKYGELYFPCKLDGEKRQTINIERSNVFGDRLDMFLFDLKRKIEEPTKPTRLKYSNENSALFCEYYSSLDRGFEKYIDTFDLREFVIKSENDASKYEVKNIETNRPISEDEWEKYKWSNNLSPENKKNKIKGYLDKLIKICGDNLK